MNYEEFLKQKEHFDTLSTEEQKKFYEQLLKNKQEKTEALRNIEFAEEVLEDCDEEMGVLCR